MKTVVCLLALCIVGVIQAGPREKALAALALVAASSESPAVEPVKPAVRQTATMTIMRTVQYADGTTRQVPETITYYTDMVREDLVKPGFHERIPMTTVPFQTVPQGFPQSAYQLQYDLRFRPAFAPGSVCPNCPRP